MLLTGIYGLGIYFPIQVICLSTSKGLMLMKPSKTKKMNESTMVTGKIYAAMFKIRILSFFRFEL